MWAYTVTLDVSSHLKETVVYYQMLFFRVQLQCCAVLVVATLNFSTTGSEVRCLLLVHVLLRLARGLAVQHGPHM